MTEAAADGRTRLRAHSLEDLSVISALVQDAIVLLGDIAYLREERSFVLAVNRFRWEAGRPGGRGERVHSGLRFDTVEKVRYRGIDRRNRSGFLSLLVIAYDSPAVTLHFASGGAIRLEVEEIRCALEDLSEPWPTQWTPRHEA